MLSEIGHVYPYHQVSMDYQFYLDRQLDKPMYSERWQIYYPQILDEQVATEDTAS